MIKIEKVTKKYSKGSPTILDKVSLQIEQGEFVILIGESGSGKTTFLKLISKLITPTSGKVKVDGKGKSEGDADSEAEVV